MQTDTERREVARRLRELRLNPWDDAACEIALCAGIVCCNSECHGSDEMPECTMALCNRLADLIEPGEPEVRCVAEVKVDGERLEELVHEAVVEYAGVDRDALLALAGEFENGARVARARKWNGSANAVMAIALADEYEANARRIREACGETANGLPTSHAGGASEGTLSTQLVGAGPCPPGADAPEKN